ncbi:hypothetical protein ACJX0J_042431 [Zea mays]
MKAQITQSSNTLKSGHIDKTEYDLDCKEARKKVAKDDREKKNRIGEDLWIVLSLWTNILHIFLLLEISHLDTIFCITVFQVYMYNMAEMNFRIQNVFVVSGAKKTHYINVKKKIINKFQIFSNQMDNTATEDLYIIFFFFLPISIFCFLFEQRYAHQSGTDDFAYDQNEEFEKNHYMEEIELFVFGASLIQFAPTEHTGILGLARPKGLEEFLQKPNN